MRLGFIGQWQKTRTAAHDQAKGQGSKLVGSSNTVICRVFLRLRTLCTIELSTK